VKRTSVLAFPYQFNRRFGTWHPIIPIRMHGPSGLTADVTAYLDSGAAFSVFEATEAVALGFDLTRGRTKSAIAGDGGILRCTILPVHFEVGGYKVLAEVGFSSDLKVGFNILVLVVFFDRFREVVFQHRHKRVLLRP